MLLLIDFIIHNNNSVMFTVFFFFSCLIVLADFQHNVANSEPKSKVWPLLLSHFSRV